MSTIVEKVETFIQRLHDLDYNVSSEASKIVYRKPSTLYSLPPIAQESKTLADYLANAISEYQQNRDNEQRRLGYARTCLLWMNRAFACGVIQEGQGLARKLAECREKNTQLEKDLERLSVQYLQLQREHEEFIKRIRLPDESDLE